MELNEEGANLMGIKISDALGYITNRKPLSSKAISSLGRQLIGCQSKIEKANNKIGQINWILQKNEELVQELDQLSEVQEEEDNWGEIASSSKDKIPSEEVSEEKALITELEQCASKAGANGK